MRVMSYNLRYDNPKDGPNAWPHRTAAVRWVLEHVQPDVVGIQEGLAHQVDELSRWFPQYAWIGRGRNADGSGEQVAIFFRRDRFRCVDSGHFWLSDTPEVPGSKSFGNQVVRMATWARLQDADGLVWLVLNTHLDHQSPEARARGAALVRQFLDTRPEHAVIVTGDFNDQPASPAVMRFVGDGAYVDAVAAAGDEGPTFHAFTGEGRSRIDYILVHRALTVTGGGVVRERPGGAFPSDHFPIYACLEQRTV